MDFYENFNRICNERGITPTALLKKMGVSTNKVTMWGNGSLPKQDMLIRLAHELHCVVMDFFQEGDEDIEIHSSTYFVLDEDEQDIIKIYRLMPRKEKHELMAYAYSLEKDATDERK